MQSLLNQGRRVSILSGDNEAAVGLLANELGVHDYISQALPEDKLAYIDQQQKNGDVVVMVGDGINDAPVLARAQVSIAMGGGTQLASVSSDMVLLSDRLEHLIDAFAVTTKTMRIVKQNIVWALIYNFSAIPAAAMGFVPPWLAAIGMSASSLIVVANSLRILR
jgi:Cu2+-exporting ATPase